MVISLVMLTLLLTFKSLFFPLNLVRESTMFGLSTASFIIQLPECCLEMYYFTPFSKYFCTGEV